MSASYLEDGAEDEANYDSTSLKDLKKQIREGKADHHAHMSEEDRF